MVIRKGQPVSLNVQQKDRVVSHKNQAGPVSRRLLFPALLLHMTCILHAG